MVSRLLWVLGTEFRSQFKKRKKKRHYLCFPSNSEYRVQSHCRPALGTTEFWGSSWEHFQFSGLTCQQASSCWCQEPFIEEAGCWPGTQMSNTMIKNFPWRAGKDGSVVKSPICYPRGPGFDSQHPHTGHNHRLELWFQDSRDIYLYLYLLLDYFLSSIYRVWRYFPSGAVVSLTHPFIHSFFSPLSHTQFIRLFL